MTAQIAHDMESVKSVIKRELLERYGGMLISDEGTMRSVQKMLRVTCSGEKFDRAIGSLISHGELVRHRPEPLGRDDESRPITIRFANFATGLGSHRSTFAH